MRRRARGSAVVLALLVVAVAAAAASVALERQDTALRRLGAARDHAQALWMLRGGAQWARFILAEDARASEIDHPGELWAGGLAPTELEGGTLAGAIADAQGLFNLANLLRDGAPSERDLAALERLVAALGLPPALARAIAAAQPMREMSELARVHGLDEAAAARLRPFLTLLPSRTAVNVNTAPAEVLVAVVDGLTPAEALGVAQSLRASPARSRADFRARLPRPELAPGEAVIAVQSAYFHVQGAARFGAAQARLEALLARRGSALPALVWQRFS